MQRAAKALITSLAFLSMAMAARAGDKPSKDAAARAQAVALFQKALAVSDIRAPGSPPFELEGKIQIQGGGKDAYGTYLLKWAAPDRWREEIRFANFTYLLGSAAGREWLLRSLDFVPMVIHDFTSAFDYQGDLRVQVADPDWGTGKKDKLKVETRNVDGVKANCVHAESKGPAGSREYCFDAQGGTLLSEENLQKEQRVGVIEFTDYSAFGEKQFPGRVRWLKDKNLLIEFQTLRLTPLDKQNESAFVPPNGSVELPDCDGIKPEPAKLIRHELPIYPPIAKSRRLEGTVRAFATLGADGILHGLQVYSSPDPALSAAALQAFRVWRYKPMTCRGQPAETYTEVRAEFTLGPR
jgi:TonB family protein